MMFNNHWLKYRHKLIKQKQRCQLIDVLDQMCADGNADEAEKIVRKFLQFLDEKREEERQLAEIETGE